MFPVPVEPIPIEVLLFDQLKLSPPPEFAENAGTEIKSPEQTEIFAIGATTG